MATLVQKVKVGTECDGYIAADVNRCRRDEL